MPFATRAAEDVLVPPPLLVIFPERIKTRLPDLLNRGRPDLTKYLPPEDILLAGDDSAVAEDRHARGNARARPSQWGGHVSHRRIRDLSSTVTRSGDHGAAQRPNPLIVPGFHLGKVLPAFGKDGHDQWRAALQRLAAQEKRLDVLQNR